MPIECAAAGPPALSTAPAAQSQVGAGAAASVRAHRFPSIVNRVDLPIRRFALVLIGPKDEPDATQPLYNENIFVFMTDHAQPGAGLVARRYRRSGSASIARRRRMRSSVGGWLDRYGTGSIPFLDLVSVASASASSAGDIPLCTSTAAP